MIGASQGSPWQGGQWQGDSWEGQGWIFFQDNENTYVMTTKNVINGIESKSKESEPMIRIEFQSLSSYEAIVTKLRDSVVVSSDEGSLLNYAVIKYSSISSISSNGSSRRPFTIGKLCSPPAGTKIKFHCGIFGLLLGCILPYPSNLIEFLKKTTRFHAGFSQKSSIIFDHTYFGEVERNKDICLFITNVNVQVNVILGCPMSDFDLNVLGMFSSQIYIIPPANTRSTVAYMCSFAVPIDKIVKDIYRKIPELAKKIFPDFLAKC